MGILLLKGLKIVNLRKKSEVKAFDRGYGYLYHKNRLSDKGISLREETSKKPRGEAQHNLQNPNSLSLLPGFEFFETGFFLFSFRILFFQGRVSSL